MADVDLVATTDFSYSTRRLKAGDTFTVPAPMAKVLVGIGKAELPRGKANVPAPPRALVQKVVKAAKIEKESKPVGAVSTRSVAVDKPKAARRARKSTAKK